MRSRVQIAEALRIILRPARRPLLQLLAVAGILFALRFVGLGTASCPGMSLQRKQYLLAAVRIEHLSAGLRKYRADCGRYPTAWEGLAQLWRSNGEACWHGPYISESATDPWNRPYIYDADSNPPKVVSYGADGIPGGEYFDADLSSANLTYAIAETPQERRSRLLSRAIWCAALLTLGVSAYGLVRIGLSEK